jgi:acylphosphatase
VTSPIDDDERVRYRVVVQGLVQGVWFRESCRREALAAGVAGWVRNRADGSVEVHAEGRESDVARVVAWCRSGPPMADVSGIDVTAEPAEGATGFQVR